MIENIRFSNRGSVITEATEYNITFFTAHIRRMTEGNVFTLSTIAGGEVPPSQVQTGGVPPSQMGEGTPYPGGGVGGYPLPRSRLSDDESELDLTGNDLIDFL